MTVQKIYSSEREIAEIWKFFLKTDRKRIEVSEKTNQKMNKLSGEFDRKWGCLIKTVGESATITNDKSVKPKIFQSVAL